MGLSRYRLDVQVAVTDMAQAEDFYEAKLGLSAKRSGADGSKVYGSGGDSSLVVYPAPDTAGGSSATLATWYVDDVEQMVDELTTRGVKFDQYDGVLERVASTTPLTSVESRLAPGVARWRGSRILMATSSRSRVIDRSAWCGHGVSRTDLPISRPVVLC